MVESAVSCYVLTSCEGLSQNMVDFVHKRRAGCEMPAYSTEGNVTRCEKIRSASERSGPSGSDARGSPATTAADVASKARAHASQGKRDGGSSDSLKELMEPTNPQWLRVCTNWLPAAHNVTRWGPSHVRAGCVAPRAPRAHAQLWI